MIAESQSEKILGILVNNKMDWKDHYEHINNVLRQQIGVIKRISFKIPRRSVLRLLDGLVYSHVRYCLPVFAQPRLSENDPVNGLMKTLQITINNGLRVALGVKKAHKIQVSKLHDQCKASTLNHLAIQSILKLTSLILEGKCDGLKGFFDEDEIGHEYFTRSQAKGLLENSMKGTCFRQHGICIWNACQKENAAPRKEIEISMFPC